MSAKVLKVLLRHLLQKSGTWLKEYYVEFIISIVAVAYSIWFAWYLLDMSYHLKF